MARRSRPRGKQVAVVEEAANNIYSMKFVLDSLGYDARSYAYPSEYLPGLVQFSPKLILVDMMISGGGGYSAIREIRESGLKEVPIIAVTAEAMEGDEPEIYHAGAQDVLAKPYTVTELKKKLEKWVS